VCDGDPVTKSVAGISSRFWTSAGERGFRRSRLTGGARLVRSSRDILGVPAAIGICVLATRLDRDRAVLLHRMQAVARVAIRNERSRQRMQNIFYCLDRVPCVRQRSGQNKLDRRGRNASGPSQISVMGTGRPRVGAASMMHSPSATVQTKGAEFSTLGAIDLSSRHPDASGKGAVEAHEAGGREFWRASQQRADRRQRPGHQARRGSHREPHVRTDRPAMAQPALRLRRYAGGRRGLSERPCPAAPQHGQGARLSTWPCSKALR
jgi:hypothetical protein